MRAPLIVYFFVIVASTATAQSKVEWSENYKLAIEDFLGSGTQIGGSNVSTVQVGSKIEFAYQMTNGEFMMTKNWNEKVVCTFTRSSAYLVAPDDTIASNLISFAQFDFDLAELHARKIRKAMFEEKKWSSNPNIFQPIYDRIHQEYTDIHVKVAKETELGTNTVLLKKYHDDVLAQISEYPDFCKTCKPVKKKK